MLPPAPARFSTTMDWFSACPSLVATARATASVVPPGANGTISRMGREG